MWFVGQHRASFPTSVYIYDEQYNDIPKLRIVDSLVHFKKINHEMSLKVSQIHSSCNECCVFVCSAQGTIVDITLLASVVVRSERRRAACFLSSPKSPPEIEGNEGFVLLAPPSQ